MSSSVCIVGTLIRTAVHLLFLSSAILLWLRALTRSSGAGPSGLVAAKSLLTHAPAGTFTVVLYDDHAFIGGLWPSSPMASPMDNWRRTSPMSATSQSRHTVQFSDLAWESDAPQFPRAWMVGRYLKRYFDEHLEPRLGLRLGLELELDSTVVKVERTEDQRWLVHAKRRTGTRTGGGRGTTTQPQQQARKFDYLIVASGYHGEPTVPSCFQIQAPSIPIIHSCQYRDLESLLGKTLPRGGKILVVGDQPSGVEISGTIASHLSSASHSPTPTIKNADAYCVHHVISTPYWVLPLFTTPDTASRAPPFLPVDLSLSDVSARDSKAVSSHGPLSDDAAAKAHAWLETALGNQSCFHPLLHPSDEARRQPPRVALSDWYCELVRQGTIKLSLGTVERLQGCKATLSDGGAEIDDIAAVVLATGFDASSRLDFLPEEILGTLGHMLEHHDPAPALAFHGTHHPDIPRLGFVGYDQGPYWGVMQMQARFLTRLWSQEPSEAMKQALADHDSISKPRALRLRGQARAPLTPMYDYLVTMAEFAAALSISPSASFIPPLPTTLSIDEKSLDVCTPSRYIMPEDDASSKQEALKSITETRDLAVDALTTTRFVARAVFRSLLGRWRLERTITSRSPSHPSGTFSGIANFFLRNQTPDGMSCGPDPDGDGGFDLTEYLYVEEGEFRTESGLGFRATRRYVWRYNAKRDVLGLWFVKTKDPKRADYFFHEIEFVPKSRRHKADSRDGDAVGGEVGERGNAEAQGWEAKAGHHCVEDYYDVKYDFDFDRVNLRKWGQQYTVNGPKKDYTIQGTYQRD